MSANIVAYFRRSFTGTSHFDLAQNSLQSLFAVLLRCSAHMGRFIASAVFEDLHHTGKLASFSKLSAFTWHSVLH